MTEHKVLTFTPIIACEISLEKPIPRELSQPTLSHEHIIENFTKDLEGRQDGQHGQPGPCEGALHTAASWPQKLTLLVKKLVKLNRSKSSLIERDFRN